MLSLASTTSGVRLTWVDGLRLTTLARPAVDLGRTWGSWTFSPDRSTLAIVAGDNSDTARLRFVNLGEMRVVGGLDVGPVLDSLVWLRPDRLLAVSEDSIAVVDPTRGALLRAVPLPGTPDHIERVDGGIVLLVAPDGGAPAMLAVADAEGTLRTVSLDRIAIGGVGFDEREPGLAVDGAHGRAFVVGVDQTIAAVNLDTLAVEYHGGKTRTLAKVEGTIRQALWLGHGLLAISGHSAPDGPVRPLGLRLVDTRTWKTRVVDRWVDGIERAKGSSRFVASSAGASWLTYVYDLRGKLRYRVRSDAGWLYLAGAYGYLCERGRVKRVVGAADGKTLRVPRSAQPCPYLLSG